MSETESDDAADKPERKSKPVIVIHVTEPPPRARHPCEVGHHRWAWLVDGRQACGYCGTMRRG